jgi:hypothetical protein
VKAIRNVAGLAVLLILAAVFMVGARSSDGSQIVAPLGDSARATGRSLGGSIGLGWVHGLAGNPRAGVAVAAALALAAILLVPAAGASAGRRLAAVVAGAAVGAVVYHPQLIGGAA